jgi:hypothetical protein
MNIKYPKVYNTYMNMNFPPTELLKWMYIRLFEKKIACGPMRRMARRFSEENHRLGLRDPKAENLGYVRGGDRAVAFASQSN